MYFYFFNQRLDEDQGIRLLAQNYWAQKVDLPLYTADRMIMILEKLYSPDTEGKVDNLYYFTQVYGFNVISVYWLKRVLG
jgi:hypothetical protein